MATETPKIGPSFVDGIASTPAIDTSGEIVDLAGIDCSSLVGGALNWEHKNDIPAQIVGKILEYKKIFSEADCENDRHKYYWEKCRNPYLYVMGRLFDDKKESSKECAALFLDDAEHPDESPMVSFSIEGSRVDKKGLIVTKSIARKLTITHQNANKQCVAELIPGPEQKQDSEDSIFKSEPTHTIPLQKSEGSWSKMPNTKSGVHAWKHPEHGAVSLNTTAGKFDVSHNGTNVGHFTDKAQALKGTDKYMKDMDLKGMKKAEKLKKDGNMPAPAASPAPKPDLGWTANPTPFGNPMSNLMSGLGMGKKEKKKPNLKKAMTAGSGMAGPGTLSGGAALSKESLDKKMKKAELLKRAKEAYQTWEKREAFENFMAKSMPHLAKGEVAALGQVLALSKSMKAEGKLAKMLAPKEKATENEIGTKFEKKMAGDNISSYIQKSKKT